MVHTTHRNRSGSGRFPHSAKRSRRRRAACCDLLDRCLRQERPIVESDRPASSDRERAWDRLVASYGPRIRELILGHCRDAGLRPQAAELDEIVQEYYLRWISRSARFRGTTKPEFWRFLHTSARNLAVDLKRRASCAKRDPGRMLALPIAKPSGGAGRDWPALQAALAERGSPETRLLDRELVAERVRRFVELCHQALEQPGDRDVATRALLLAVLDGRSSREVSRDLGRAGQPVTRNQVDRWVHRLRSAARRRGLATPRRCPEPDAPWPAKLLVGVCGETCAGATGTVSSEAPG